MVAKVTAWWGVGCGWVGGCIVVVLDEVMVLVALMVVAAAVSVF